MTNFPIEGGKGYIVNVLLSKSVEIEGRAWFSAPHRYDIAGARLRQEIWAFAVGGEVGFGERVMVRNIRSGEVASGAVIKGRFALAFGGKQGREVVREGDVVEVLVYDGSKLAGRGEVKVGIEELERFNTAGELIRRIELGNQTAGWYVTKDRAAFWNGRNKAGEGVASGIYFYKLRAGNYSAVRKMLIVK